MTKRTTRRLALLWTLAILVALAWPRPALPESPTSFPLDKVVHVSLFAGLSALWLLGLHGPFLSRILCVLAGGLLFAALTEAGQDLMPLGRTGSVADTVADAAGLALGVGVFFGVRRYWLAAPSSCPKARPPARRQSR